MPDRIRAVLYDFDNGGRWRVLRLPDGGEAHEIADCATPAALRHVVYETACDLGAVLREEIEPDNFTRSWRLEPVEPPSFG